MKLDDKYFKPSNDVRVCSKQSHFEIIFKNNDKYFRSIKFLASR